MKRLIDTVDQGTYLKFDCNIDYTESEFDKWPKEYSLGKVERIGSYGYDAFFSVEVLSDNGIEDIIVVLVSYDVMREVFGAREPLEERIRNYVLDFGWKELAELFEPFKGEEK